MSDVKQARTLFGAATRDLSAIRGMFDSEVFADEIFGFHVQQAAEKLCKAWIALLGKEYPFIHDLERLLEILDNSGIVVTPLLPLTEYNPYAGWMRYDDRVISAAQSIDRKDALRRIEEFHQQVLNQLPEVANP